MGKRAKATGRLPKVLAKKKPGRPRSEDAGEFAVLTKEVRRLMDAGWEPASLIARFQFVVGIIDGDRKYKAKQSQIVKAVKKALGKR